MNRILYLDDLRTPLEVKDGVFTIVRNFEEFKYQIENSEQFDYISFDNDLATDPIDGQYIADWLLNYFINNEVLMTSIITIHSDNSVAVDNIKSKFDTYFKVFNINKKAVRFQWDYEVYEN